MTLQALDDDEMMRQYAELLARQDSAREDALKALQARTAMRAEVAGLEVPHPCNASIGTYLDLAVVGLMFKATLCLPADRHTLCCD